MECSLFKSFTTGLQPVRQAVYAPSNFGVATHNSSAPDSTSVYGSSAETIGSYLQAHHTRVHHSAAPHNVHQESGTDLPAPNPISTIRKKLPSTSPENRGVSYLREVDEHSNLTTPPILGELDDWVMVDANLQKRD
ncbi:unnamed protein product [Rhizoctonia solani]|uniref:Uncharacterized protein n=1 Tax=Rhizoctonia solani TaxID=456999 RepID=A0A8H3A1M7_9AGAM|nr:unnamed protein product [Rhizoctonia solani]